MIKSSLVGESIFNGYLISNELGGGANGAVYKAVKKTLVDETTRAIKHIILPTEEQFITICESLEGDEQKIKDYYHKLLTENVATEIRILNRLSEKNTPNIIRYYDHEVVSKELLHVHNIYILMEYLTPISTYIASMDMTVEDVVRMGLDVLSALELCHNEGVIRGDVIENHIFVDTRTNTFKISAFGVARILKDTIIPVNTTSELGNKKVQYTESGDLHSLGTVLYRLLNHNRNPVNGANAPEHGGAHIGEVILKSISNSTEQYATAREFYTALQSAMSSTEQNILTLNIKTTKNPLFPNYDNAGLEKEETKSAEQLQKERYDEIMRKSRQNARNNITPPDDSNDVLDVNDDIILNDNSFDKSVDKSASDTTSLSWLSDKGRKKVHNHDVTHGIFFEHNKNNLLDDDEDEDENKEKKAMLILILDDDQHEKILIESAPFLMGRKHKDMKIDCCFEDDRNVSRLHASIGFYDNKYYLTDKKSRNGTFLNGEKIEQNTPIEIKNGDNIIVGHQEMVFKL